MGAITLSCIPIKIPLREACKSGQYNPSYIPICSMEEYIVYNFVLTDIYGDTYETCYRMYKRTTSIGHDESGRPTGYGIDVLLYNISVIFLNVQQGKLIAVHKVNGYKTFTGFTQWNFNWYAR